MFENISEKIKTFAVVTTVIGMIASVILGLGSIGEGGIIIGVLGCVGSWVSSFVLYGFGELIELLETISGNTSNNANKSLLTKKTCPLCHTEVLQSESYCKHCGQKLN